jgi:hypothetical protein
MTDEQQIAALREEVRRASSQPLTIHARAACNTIAADPPTRSV